MPNVGDTPTLPEVDQRICGACEGAVNAGMAFSVHTSMSRRHRQHLRAECTECAWQCADCSEWFSSDLRDGASQNAADDPICEPCGENYSWCDVCESTVHNDDYAGDNTCQSCYDSAHEDDEEEEEEEDEPPTPIPAMPTRLQVLAAEYTRARRGSTVARAQLKGPRSVSDRTRRAYEAAYEQDCERGRNAWRPPPAVINEYRYKPAPMFYHRGVQVDIASVPADMPFYGIEVESECMGCPMGHALESRVRNDPVWYAKSDGSLSAGAEFVSHPCSFSEWMKHDFDLFHEKVT